MTRNVVRGGAPRGLGLLIPVGLMMAGAPLGAQQADSAQEAPDTSISTPDSSAISEAEDDGLAPLGEPVVFGGDTLFRIHGTIGPFGPEERARAVEGRLEMALQDSLEATDTVRVSSTEGGLAIVIGERVLMSVTPADAAPLGVSPDVVAAAWAATLQAALEGDVAGTRFQRLLPALGGTLLALGVLVGALYLMGRLFPILYLLIRRRGRRLPAVRIQRLEILSTKSIVEALVKLAWLVRTVLTILLVVVFTPLVLGLFAATRGLSQQLTAWMLSPFLVVLRGIVDYLPNVFSIAVIIVVTWYGLRLIKVLFKGLERGALHIPGFHQDWAVPTYQIVRVLIIVLTLILVWPYLPSSESGAFRGVAAFLGLLLTFGSASAVANVVGGVVMIYMRPFQVGDRVKISDTVGDVVQKGLLVTRIRTIKRVEITIPNSMVLSSHIVNYSATAAEDGIILHTSVTIGYDAPWRKVHKIMLSAARDIDGILEQPPPFVLQTALGDYAITYELNASTDRPGRMAALYSRLHENLQDRFAEAGIEITSPAYHALRDGDANTIPEREVPTEKGGGAVEARAEEALAKAAIEAAARAEEAVGVEAKAQALRESAEKAQALSDAAAEARGVRETGGDALDNDPERAPVA